MPQLQPHFAVSKDGLAKLLARRPKAFIAYELLQNAFDEHTTVVNLSLEYQGYNKALIVVEDDSPEGFADLSHAYTLYAESAKKADPTKRGRFNLGEKLVIAACTTAEIETTKGTVTFTPEGREMSRHKRASGTVFTGRFQATAEEVREALHDIRAVIVPAHITCHINGGLVPSRTPVAEFEASLPTEVSDDEGYLKRTTRKTMVRLYEPVAHTRTGDPDNRREPQLYEMGIPVVTLSDRWDVDVQQKVPLNADRDNVTPAYLATLRTLVVNHMAKSLTNEEASKPWVGTVLADVEPEALNIVLDRRFGEKRVIADLSDPEGTKLAMAKGYTVIPGGTFNRATWDNIRHSGAALPAGQVTPSPKVVFGSGPQVKEVKHTPEMERTIDFIQELAVALLGRQIKVQIWSEMTFGWEAAYGQADGLMINLARVGHHWFGEPSAKQIELLLHEFAHEWVSDHLSERFGDTVANLGANLAFAVAKGKVKLPVMVAV